MKIKMASDCEYFEIGSIVETINCHGKKLKGEVMAFDAINKVLAISILFVAAFAVLADKSAYKFNVYKLLKVQAR